MDRKDGLKKLQRLNKGGEFGGLSERRSMKKTKTVKLARLKASELVRLLGLTGPRSKKKNLYWWSMKKRLGLLWGSMDVH